MDSWVVGQLAFWYTVYEISPTMVVDKLVQFWLDVTVPGRGVGGSNWCVCVECIRSIDRIEYGRK